MTTIATEANAPTKRFTAEEVLRMAELGLLDADEQVELLEGELVVVTPQGPSHVSMVGAIAGLLAAGLPADAHVRPPGPFLADHRSLPEPDIAVVRGRHRDWLRRHPTGHDLLLAVEVSVTSQRLDRAKARLYARSGVPEYWLVDVPARRVVVHRDAAADGYRSVVTLAEDEHLSPQAFPGGWRVAELLP